MKAEDRAKKTIKRMKGKSPYGGSWWSWDELEKLLAQEIRKARRDIIEECAKANKAGLAEILEESRREEVKDD